MDIEVGTIVRACPGVDLYPMDVPRRTLFCVLHSGPSTRRTYPASFPPKYEGPVSPQAYLKPAFHVCYHRSASILSLHTMWSPFHPIASLAAGLLGNLQQPLNINLDNTTGLTANQFSAFTPYIEFARAAYCDANKIAGWKCGGEPFPLRLCASLAYREGKKKPAMLFPVSCRL